MEMLYHGSKLIIKNPAYGKGNPENDYGLGFYCTREPELAKEWACPTLDDGFCNAYELETKGLTLLDLQSEQFCTLHP